MKLEAGAGRSFACGSPKQLSFLGLLQTSYLLRSLSSKLTCAMSDQTDLV